MNLIDRLVAPLLPTPTSGGGRRLPDRPLLTARTLPRTTAAMLELDRLHRTWNQIGPALRGKTRWVAADANRCDYRRAFAEADLLRAGSGDEELATLKGDPDRWPAGERSALPPGIAPPSSTPEIFRRFRGRSTTSTGKSWSNTSTRNGRTT